MSVQEHGVVEQDGGSARSELGGSEVVSVGVAVVAECAVDGRQ